MVHQCRFCHSTNIKKDGSTIKGQKRYKCNTCMRYFQDIYMRSQLRVDPMNPTKFYVIAAILKQLRNAYDNEILSTEEFNLIMPLLYGMRL